MQPQIMAKVIEFLFLKCKSEWCRFKIKSEKKWIKLNEKTESAMESTSLSQIFGGLRLSRVDQSIRMAALNLIFSNFSFPFE